MINRELCAANDTISNVGAKFALTTVDNPYDPFVQYHDWLLYDEKAGYCCNSYLARIANVSPLLSDKENNDQIELAIDEILKYDFTKMYKKAINPDYKETSSELDV